MSAVDDIVEEIVARCIAKDALEFSCEIIQEDYLIGHILDFAKEIEEKLKTKGITVG